MEPYRELEKKFGDWASAPNMVGCSSGTAALHLALESLDLSPGSEVIVPEFTMIACARAVTTAGLVPVFVDCTDDLLIDIDLVTGAITDKTEAIMPVHVYGRRCDMDAIVEIAKHQKLVVIEDMAEIHGVRPHHLSDAACWSFYKNKIVFGEEGGAVSFKNGGDANKARQLRSLGFTDSHNFLHIPRGMNYRLSNAHAQLILSSLESIEYNVNKRFMVETWYNELMPSSWKMPKRDAVWVYDLKLPGVNTSQVVSELNDRGVAARLGFKPMSMQPEYQTKYHHLRAFGASQEIIYLPVYPDMDTSHVMSIWQHLHQSVEKVAAPTPTVSYLAPVDGQG
jgi:perosamine synthetase